MGYLLGYDRERKIEVTFESVLAQQTTSANPKSVSSFRSVKWEI
jgi:hypothetical protein